MAHFVFAYGSNMDLDDLARWAGEKGFPPPRILAHHLALLRGYQRVWNYRSEARRGGAANVQPSEDGSVYGVALEVDGATLRLIDQKEGHPGRYSRGEVPVEVELPHQGRVISAWLYVVTEGYISPELIPPRPEYLEIILRSAKAYGFPKEKLEELKTTPTWRPSS